MKDHPVRDSDVPDGKWLQLKERRRAGPGSERPPKTDDYTVQGAELFIEQHFLNRYVDRAPPDVPTLLKVSLQRSHYPYIANEHRFSYYLNRVEPHVEQPPDHRMPRGHWQDRYRVNAGKDATRELTRATTAYYALIETADAMFGRVLDALKAPGEDLEEWIIVFCSDHGEMLAQHGTWETGRFYGASAGVPLFIR